MECLGGILLVLGNYFMYYIGRETMPVRGIFHE